MSKKITPKKQLGQNFLVDCRALLRLVEYLKLEPKEVVWEIGAGRGELTQYLAAGARKVTAFEIDRRLIPLLEEKFKHYPGIKVKFEDFLKFEPLRNEKKVKLIGNIPYHLSTPILERIVKLRKHLGAVYLTVQKEFALRICALPGSKDYGRLSCFVQYYFSPRILFKISRNSFFPAPKVDSALVELMPLDAPAVKVNDEKLLFEIIKAAFAQRRKTLKNCLKEKVPQPILDQFFSVRKVNPSVRGENLSLIDFAVLTNLLS